jgi:arsenate reductase-like glutaredoxin family protein
LAERQLSDDELLDLMVEEPTLLRRPLIISPGGVAVGFNQKQLQELIESPEIEPSRKEE